MEGPEPCEPLDGDAEDTLRCHCHPLAHPALARGGSGEMDALGPFTWVLFAFELVTKLHSSQM